ncbi:MAG: DMT family transporter [Thermoplasmata archaeon]|jgi:drug/metabolite transporter (DMT)-like permease
MANSKRGDPVALLILAVLGGIWGATFPVAKLGIGAGANPFLLVTVDLLLATITLAAISTLTRAVRPNRRELGISAAIGALLIGGINLPLFWGEQFATGGAAAIVYATSPLVSIVAAWALGARLGLTWLQRGALAVGLLGVIVLALTSIGTNVLSNGWAIAAFALGAVCQGTGTVLFARMKPVGESRWGLTFELLGASGAALVALPVAARSLSLPTTTPVLISIVFVGFGTLALGYLLFFELVRRAGPVRANVVTFLNPIVALAVGVFVFGEAFQTFELAGLGIVLVALGMIEGPSMISSGRFRTRGSVVTETTKGSTH